MRVERCELRLERARLGERQDIAGRERTAGNPAEPGAGVGCGRAEHVWHIDAAGDRDIAPGTGVARADREFLPGLEHRNRGARQRPAGELDAKRAAGDRERDRGIRRKLEAAERDFDGGRVPLRAGGGIGGREREPIHRPRGGDAEAQISVPSAVLQRHAGPGGEDAQRGHGAGAGNVWSDSNVCSDEPHGVFPLPLWERVASCERGEQRAG